MTPDNELIIKMSNLITEAKEIILAFVDFDNECSVDHHGDCQEHSSGNPCTNQLMIEWLDKVKEIDL